MRRYFVLLFLLLCPMIVLADSAGPSIVGYDAVIINKNGYKTTDGDDKEYVIPYNTKIHVYDEYDGTASACHIEYAKDCYDDNDRFNIPLKDIAVLKEEILPADLAKKDNGGTTLSTVNSKVIISSKSGVKLKKGPADVYGYYDQTIPYETIMNFKYAIERSRFGLSWVYVDENGYKGWIEQGNDEGTFCVLYDSAVLTFNAITITDSNNNKIEIPKETLIDTVYLGYPTIYVNYKGTLGKIERDKFFVGYKGNLGYIYTNKNAELKSSSGKTITAIPKGKTIKIMYAEREDVESDFPYHYTSPVCIKDNECYYYIEYNGNKGFVSDKNVISLYYEEKDTNIDYEENIKLYDVNCYNDMLSANGFNFVEYDKKCDTGKTIPANTKFRYYYQTGDLSNEKSDISYYVSLIKYQNNYYLTIHQNGNPITSNGNDDSNKEEDVTIVDDDKQDSIDNRDTETTTDNTIEKNNNDNRVLTIIMWALIAAGILSLTAFVTIMFINKKKALKKKTDDKKEEVKEPIKKSKKKKDK